MAAKFELVSKFQPAGDQPPAIEKLVAGLREGRRYQTLLGATGTGKSLAWDEPVLVRHVRGADGAAYLLRPIGELIDALLPPAAPSDLTGDATELVAPPRGLEVLSFNPDTCAAEWRRVTACSRHAAPRRMYRVRTECGREVTVTGDHNFLSLRGGDLAVKRTIDLGEEDYLPLPLRCDLGGRRLGTIDLLD